MDDRRHRALLVADGLAKAFVVVVLLFAVTHDDWSRFADKGMTSRLLLYPLMLAVVPVGWSIANRGTGRTARDFPVVADLLITLSFVVDVGGNLLDLYDSVTWFDDLCHFLNWGLLTAGVGALLMRRRDLAPWVLAWMCVGFGAASAIVWEGAEYVAFVANGSEFATAYRDTVGDLLLGLAGSCVAAVIVGLTAARSVEARDIVTA